MTKEKFKKAIDVIGLPRLIVFCFFLAIVITAAVNGIDVCFNIERINTDSGNLPIFIISSTFVIITMHRIDSIPHIPDSNHWHLLPPPWQSVLPCYPFEHQLYIYFLSFDNNCYLHLLSFLYHFP